MQNNSDEELIALLHNSDSRAFTELYERYWDKLFYVAGKKLDNLHEAENIVQDVFMDLWKRREILNITGSVGGYLIVAVKYKVISFQKKRYRQLSIQSKDGLESSIPDNSTEHLIRYHELQRQYDDELSKLPEKCKFAFSLRNEGLSYKDIADTMDVSVKTVEMHVSHALKTLRINIGSIFLSILTLIGLF